MDDNVKKETQDKKKLQVHVLDDDAVVDVSDEERTFVFEEDSGGIEEVFLDSDSEECLSGTEESSSFGEEDSSLEKYSDSEEEEYSDSEEEEDNLWPVQSENGQI
jgi:hypothetical protein